ncbi:MAG: hypothetical protein EPO24_09420 [Bacteroidetes bacterium]|nr:MAG: hypothetical protein EPO24_09420 [Bacteroidota bacterium]
MLKNFLVDNDLKKYYPNIANQLWSAQADYSTQISKAFSILLNELQHRGINPRLCMVPLDLKREDDTAANAGLVSVTETATTTGDPFEGGNQLRLVVNITAITGTWSWKLQGCNLVDEPASDSSEWKDVTSAAISNKTAAAEHSVVFTEMFRWYRLVTTENAAGSVTYTACLYETVFDDVIAYGTFVLIFTDFMLEVNDIWDMRRQFAQNAYSAALESIKFGYDADDDGVPDLTEQEETATIRLVR